MTIDTTIELNAGPDKAPTDPMQWFKKHLVIYMAVNLMLFITNLTGNLEKMWYIYPLLGWGIGLISHWYKDRSYNS